MHMKVIYGTSSKDNAKEIIKELKQGEKLVDILNIDDDSLDQFIPEADYVTVDDRLDQFSPVDAFGDKNEDHQESVPKKDWGKISKADRKDVFHLVSEYFNSQYFDLTEGQYYIKAVQKPDALAKYEQMYEKLLAKVIKVSRLAGIPLANPDFWIKYNQLDQATKDKIDQACENTDVMSLQFNLRNTNPFQNQYNPAFISIDHDIWDRMSDSSAKVTAIPKTYYIFPQLISDFHC